MRIRHFRGRRRPAQRLVLALLLLAGCQHSEPARPSIILISIDTLRADYLSGYGYPAATSPALDALARDGVRFTQAIVQVPHTLKWHMSILTSLYPEVHRVDMDRALATHHHTLTQALKDAGYDTAAFSL